MRGLINIVQMNQQHAKERAEWRKQQSSGDAEVAEPTPTKEEPKQMKAWDRGRRFRWHTADVHVMDHQGQIVEDVGGLGTYAKPAWADTPKESATDDHESEWSRHAKSFTPDHHAWLAEYKDVSEELNDHLRGRRGKAPDEDFLEMHQHLQHITDHRLTKPLTVFRGFGDDVDLSRLRKNNVILDHGFTSTSLHPGVAHGFGRTQEVHHSWQPHRVFAQIHLPVGTKAYHVDRHKFQFGGEFVNREKEVLLHHGSRFKVLGHAVTTMPNTRVADGHAHIVHLEAIPHE